eukprot:363256-Chlamydomonas_euryale.AAC.8
MRAQVRTHPKPPSHAVADSLPLLLDRPPQHPSYPSHFSCWTALRACMPGFVWIDAMCPSHAWLCSAWRPWAMPQSHHPKNMP